MRKKIHKTRKDKHIHVFNCFSRKQIDKNNALRSSTAEGVYQNILTNSSKVKQSLRETLLKLMGVISLTMIQLSINQFTAFFINPNTFLFIELKPQANQLLEVGQNRF